MNDNVSNINKIHDDNQLMLFGAADDSVEDLIYEFLKDRGASTERAYIRQQIRKYLCIIEKLHTKRRPATAGFCGIGIGEDKALAVKTTVIIESHP